MPVTEICIYEENGLFYLSDKGGLSHFSFNTSLERDIFIAGFPPPKPKISHIKMDFHTYLSKSHKVKSFVTIEGDADEATDS